MVRGDAWFVMPLFAILTPACASVIGADFDDVHPQPSSCNLVAPSSHDPTHYTACADGDGCYLTQSGKAECIAPSQEGVAGDACTYSNDCGPGLACVPPLGCVANCRVGGSDCAGSVCIAYDDPSTVSGVEYGFCALPPCDPSARGLAGDGLAACSTQCRFITNTTTGCLTTAGTVGVGVTCSQDSDCVATANCAPAPNGSGMVCTRTCRVGEADCPSGQTCHGATDDASRTTLNGVEYGYCGT